MDAFDYKKRTLLHRNVDFSTKQTTDEIKQIYAEKLKQADINGAVFELSFPVSPSDPLHWCVRDIKDKDSALLVTFSSETVARKYLKKYKGTEDLISLASLEIPFSPSGRTNPEHEKGQISSPLSSSDEDMGDTFKRCESNIQQLCHKYQEENKRLMETLKEKEDEMIEMKKNFKEKEVSLQKEHEKVDESYRRKLQADAADIRSFHMRLQEQCDEIKALSEEKQSLLEEKDEAVESRKSAQDEIKYMKKKITKLTEENVKLKKRLDETKQDGKMYSMENQIDDLEEQIKTLEAENSKLKERNKRLSKMTPERNRAWDDNSGGEREFSSPKVDYRQSDSSFSSRLGCASDTPNSIQSKGDPVMTDDQKRVKTDAMVRGDENEYTSSESNFLSCDEPEEDKQDCIDENKQDKLGPDVREKTSDSIFTPTSLSHISRSHAQTMQHDVVPCKAAPYDYQIEEPVSPAVAHYLLKMSNCTKILHARYESVEVIESPTGLVLSGRYQDQVQKAHKRFKEHLNGIKEMEFDIPSNFRMPHNDLMQVVGRDVAVVIDKSSHIIYLAAEKDEDLEYAYKQIKEKTNSFDELKGRPCLHVAEGYLELDVYKYIVGQSMSEEISEEVALKFYPDEKEHMTRYSIKGHDKSLVARAETALVEQIQKCMHENCTQDIYTFLTKNKMEELARFKSDNQDILIEAIKGEAKIHLIGPKKKTYILKKQLCDWLGMAERSNEMDMDVDEEPIATIQGQKVTSSFGSEHEKPKQHCITYQSRSNDIKVHAMVADITKMEVDVIVNAANTRLNHDGGIALAIANAGGKKLKDACKEYMNKNKHGVQVGKHHMTVAGDLPCKYVFHAVGPQYNGDDKTLGKSLGELKNAFKSCLKGANSIQSKSIAMPAISSGIFGMPAVYVAETLANVVNDFVSTSKDHLKEIYLVDKGQQMVNLFEKQLDQQKSLIKQSASPSKPPEPSEGWTQVDYSQSRSKTSQHKRGQHRRGAAERKHGSNDGRSVRHSSHSKETQRQSSLSEYDRTSTGPENEDCPICQEPVTKRRILAKCQHVFCTDCIDEAFKYKPVCPICGVIYGRLTGNQPKNGKMQHRVDPYQHLPGYPRDGMIIIDYHFPDGYQGEDHPEPGARYRGAHRTAYLPDNTHGRKVLMLLKKAFDARLVFTVGRSVTSGTNNIVTWNDIHHKTHTHGGAQGYGYPDPDYLRRVEEELAAKGITD